MKRKGKNINMILGIILGCVLLISALSVGIFLYSIQTVSATYLAESYHPYANNYKNTWTISESGVSEIRLHFTKRELEYPDELKVLDKDGNRLETYTYHDNREDVWSEWYTGDTLKLELETDSSETAYGFAVDKIETRGEAPEPSSYVVESFHPYANNYKNTWTISESGVSEIRLHFTKRELEYPDELKVLDKDGNRLETYTYHDNREDVWSEWYTGDTLKLELETDSSETAYGFAVDKIETRGTAPLPESIPSPSPTLTQTPTPIQKPAPVISPIPSEYPTPTLKPGEPYVHLYGHKTNVIVGEEVILYLSVINPITSPGTLKVQLTLQVPSGWSITSGEFSPPVGGFQTAVYEIEQGPDTKTIGIHMLANQPFDGLITGYTDYYFVEQPETKYHKEVNEPVTAKQTEPSPSAPSLPPVTPNGGISTEVKRVIIAIFVATIGSVLARAIWSSIKKRREY